MISIPFSSWNLRNIFEQKKIQFFKILQVVSFQPWNVLVTYNHLCCTYSFCNLVNWSVTSSIIYHVTIIDSLKQKLCVPTGEYLMNFLYPQIVLLNFRWTFTDVWIQLQFKSALFDSMFAAPLLAIQGIYFSHLLNNCCKYLNPNKTPFLWLYLFTQCC